MGGRRINIITPDLPYWFPGDAAVSILTYAALRTSASRWCLLRHCQNEIVFPSVRYFEFESVSSPALESGPCHRNDINTGALLSLLCVIRP